MSPTHTHTLSTARTHTGAYRGVNEIDYEKEVFSPQGSLARAHKLHELVAGEQHRVDQVLRLD